MKIVRNLFRILCILCLFAIVSCQNDTAELKKEELINVSPRFKTTMLSKQTIETNSKLTNHMRNLATIQQSGLAETTNGELYNFTIHTDAVKLVENLETNLHSYTFAISREHSSSVLENVVFSFNELMNDYEASLITYHFSPTQRQEFDENRHVSTTYQISYEPLALQFSDIVGESSLPCTITYQEFHQPQGSSNSYLYSSNGYVVNQCEHEDDDDPCHTYRDIVIYCPPSGSSSGSGNGTDDNTTTDTTSSSTSGGGGTTTNTDTTNDEDTTNVVTSSISRKEVLEQSIIECINSVSNFNTVDNTTIDPNILDLLDLDVNTLNRINNSLLINGCDEASQEEIIEFLENIFVYPYPHCSSFEYAKPPNINIRACAVTNLTETFYAYGEMNGQTGTIAATVNYDLVFFVMPTWMTNGHAATNTAIAVNNALSLTKDWFLLNPDASETMIITYLDSKLVEQMSLFAGTKTDIPPFTIPSPAPYVTSLISTGNCN